MTIKEIANKLVDYCRTGQFDKVYQELYSPEVVSIEPEGVTWAQHCKGIDAIKEKGQHWAESIEEMHAGTVSDPIVAGTHFSCVMTNDITFKDKGRVIMEEICVYEVKDGKVIKEQFFFQKLL